LTLDILAGVDAVVADGAADGDRVAIAGTSYAPRCRWRRSRTGSPSTTRRTSAALHGEVDLCVPLSQSQELYQALAAEGVETDLPADARPCCWPGAAGRPVGDAARYSVKRAKCC
jgi:hypothetical protein